MQCANATYARQRAACNGMRAAFNGMQRVARLGHTCKWVLKKRAMPRPQSGMKSMRPSTIASAVRAGNCPASGTLLIAAPCRIKLMGTAAAPSFEIPRESQPRGACARNSQVTATEQLTCNWSHSPEPFLRLAAIHGVASHPTWRWWGATLWRLLEAVTVSEGRTAGRKSNPITTPSETPSTGGTKMRLSSRQPPVARREQTCNSHGTVMQHSHNYHVTGCNSHVTVM